MVQDFAQGPQVRPGAQLRETHKLLIQTVFFWVVPNGNGDPEERYAKYAKGKGKGKGKKRKSEDSSSSQREGWW